MVFYELQGEILLKSYGKRLIMCVQIIPFEQKKPAQILVDGCRDIKISPRRGHVCDNA